MVFHTFLGWYTAQEYRTYKDNMLYKTGQVNNGAANGKENGIDMTISGSADPDEIVSSDEYDYPKSKRLNTYVNILFTVALSVLNIIYWSVAIGVYYS